MTYPLSYSSDDLELGIKLNCCTNFLYRFSRKSVKFVYYYGGGLYRLYANKTVDLINERKFPSWNLCNSN